MIVPELLSPVGNLNHLKIAVLSGASSVYLSGHKYGARQYADNFTLNEIGDAVKYAHLHNVKVYITVNTLIKESELKECLDYVKELYFIGVDGVLIQDIGLLNLIKEYIPNLTIHASTQMKIKNIEELHWAKQSGISRIVLPRELNLKEIKKISKEAHQIGLEVEIFVHGAQCYGYSGECLFSSFKGGRSGNRGTCAQPCRQKYNIEAVNEKNRTYKINKYPEYYLSPKDLSLYKKLKTLSEIEVDCIKIEGRMRSDEYVMITTSTYRQALNNLKKKNWKKEEEIQKNAEEILKLVFNRKLNTGHLFNENTNQILNPIKPGHTGLYIGKIYEYQDNKISIKLNENLNNIPQKGDGLLIEDKNNRYYGFDISGDPSFKKSKVYWNKKQLIKEKITDNILIVKKVKENKKETIKITKGCKVYLTKRNQISKDLKQLLNQKNKPMFKKSILNLRFYLENKHPILKGTLKLGNGKTIKHTYKGEEPWQKAKNKPITPEIIEKQISKIKNKPYYLESVKISSIEKNLFTPISNLNQIRRNFLEELEEKIIKEYLPKTEEKEKVEKQIKKYRQKSTPTKIKTQPDFSIKINNPEYLKLINNPLITRVYYEIPNKEENLINNNKIDISYYVNQLKEAIKISENKKFKLIWLWPNIIHDELLNNLIKICGILNKTIQIPPIMTQQLGLENYFKNKFNIKTYGDYPLNITNTETIKKLENYEKLIISPELSKNDYENLIKNTENKEKLEITIYGNITLMISEKNILQDWMKNKIKNLDNPNNKINKIYLTDTKNNKYPIHSTVNPNEILILNYKDYSLLNHIEYLKKIGYINFNIDARWKNKKEIELINNLIDENGNIRQISKNYTVGNYEKGLL